MAEATESKIDAAKAEAAAEKAYAAAAAATPVKAEAKPEAKPAAAKVAAPVAKKAPAKAAPKKPAAKPVAAKKVAAPKKAPVKKKAAAPKAAKPAAAPAHSFKDTIMTKTKIATEDFTAKVQETVAEAQERAKAAFEKSQALFGDAGEFTKGNVEALVESGKVLAAGMQDLGKDYVAEAKTAFETVQADIKDLAAVKTPADFFKLQGEILRRNFDAAVASGSKHSEKVVKVAGEAFAPIQNRVSLAIEKVKQAA
ncbi:MAG: phasin family protein [Sphingomonadales bacterium]|mgnify:CR=1 FL=1|nr:phasin family protein [Sphingomonadales bacterium]